MDRQCSHACRTTHVVDGLRPEASVRAASPKHMLLRGVRRIIIAMSLVLFLCITCTALEPATQTQWPLKYSGAYVFEREVNAFLTSDKARKLWRKVSESGIFTSRKATNDTVELIREFDARLDVEYGAAKTLDASRTLLRESWVIDTKVQTLKSGSRSWALGDGVYQHLAFLPFETFQIPRVSDKFRNDRQDVTEIHKLIAGGVKSPITGEWAVRCHEASGQTRVSGPLVASINNQRILIGGHFVRTLDRDDEIQRAEAEMILHMSAVHVRDAIGGDTQAAAKLQSALEPYSTVIVVDRVRMLSSQQADARDIEIPKELRSRSGG